MFVIKEKYWFVFIVNVDGSFWLRFLLLGRQNWISIKILFVLHCFVNEEKRKQTQIISALNTTLKSSVFLYPFAVRPSIETNAGILVFVQFCQCLFIQRPKAIFKWLRASRFSLVYRSVFDAKWRKKYFTRFSILFHISS